ncbi:MAG: transcriptional repressor NrdR [Alphaproteobacteria bacterium]|nr:transcriptional repressor NrdR [Alphaproteobacteria bacterium]MBQ4084109.1 transcriptional repressor NrdR [Alphaproteobacteria bacterium]
MRCPFCFSPDSQVKDTRTSEDGTAIRRRRICSVCHARFTTFERVQLRELVVEKKNGERVPFDRDKLAKSIYLAVRKRPVEMQAVEKLVNEIQQKLETQGEAEIESTQIGELAMKALLKMDKVAYIRYASVYKNFTETKDFEDFIALLTKETK